MGHVLRYAGPATTWTEALPLGNGHLGAMVFGDLRADRFALNDDTAWSGGPDSELAGGAVDRAMAAGALHEARTAMRAGDPLTADAAVRRLQQRYSQAYLPWGDLIIEADGAGGESTTLRELDLRTAVHRLLAGDVERLAFVSAPDDVLVVHTRSAAPRTWRLTLSTPLREEGRVATGDALRLLVRCPADVAPTHEDVDPPLRYDTDDGASVRGALVARVAADDGAVRIEGGALVVDAATTVTVVVASATTFTGIGRRPGADLATVVARAHDTVDRALDVGVERLRERHEADHARLYGRASLRFGEARDEAADATPDTARRMARARAGGDPLAADPELAALLFHYGRYLLIASSRPGTLPATLQGVWNETLRPPWSSNYTVNINTQMNYWGAEPTGLGELVEPLFDLIEALARRGAEVARRLYGAPGWVAHHNADAWAHASPVGLGRGNPSWAFWPMAGAWLVRHFAEALDHGAGLEVAARAWPVTRGAAEFLLDWFEDVGDGRLGTVLSTSPENEFVVRAADGRELGTAAVGSSSAMDLELAADVLRLLCRLARMLGHEQDTVAVAAAAALDTLPVPSIAPDGTIKEWAGHPEARDPHHRHVSMLYGLYPGDREWSEAEHEAARRSLDRRGDEASGWSLVWKAALRARLRQADKVADLLTLVFRDATVGRGEWSGGLYPNLLAAHPPFQIDGNLGYVGALVEAIVQSHRGRVELLPALPAALADGAARGLVVRPGIVLDLDWSAGVPVSGRLTSPEPRRVRLAWRDQVRTVDLTPDEPYAFTADLWESA